jgi:hypothetical protein
MLSIQYRFLFIHVPKTGGNSIQTILKKYSEDRIVTPSEWQDGRERFEVSNCDFPFDKHCPLWKYKKHLAPDLYAQLFRFATIRNPWEMMVSLYFSPHQRRTSWDRDLFARQISNVHRPRWYLRDTLPGTRLAKDGARDSESLPPMWKVDQVMRFENLQHDFDQACSTIGIEREQLPHYNRSNREDYQKYYDSELIELVANKFSDVVSYGGYKFESAGENRE